MCGVSSMLKNLKQLREASSVSQRKLANAIGVSQQSINKYENHKIEPDIDTMIKIADYFNTSVDYLIGHTEIQRKIESTSTWELNEEERQILCGYRRLSGKKRKSIAMIIDSYNE